MTLIVRALDGSIVSKECSKCKRFLPSSEFTKANWLDGGLRSDCRKCRKIKSQNINLREIARSLDLKQYIGKACRKCGCCERKVSNGGCIKCAAARERNSVRARNYNRRYYREHYDRVIANVKSRKYAKLRRVPSWLTVEHKRQIAAIYREAHTLTKLSGIQMHVDHIIPLQGKTVSGLHVPWNLRIAPWSENLSKNNKWTGEIPMPLAIAA